MSFSVFTTIMTYKKINLGLRISTAEIYFARFLDVFLLKMQGKQVQKIQNSLSLECTNHDLLGVGGFKVSTPKIFMSSSLLLLLILASNMGSIAQESRSNHVPYFSECLIPGMCDWLIRLIEDVLEYGFPSGYEILVQRPPLSPSAQGGDMSGGRGEHGGGRSLP